MKKYKLLIDSRVDEMKKAFTSKSVKYQSQILELESKLRLTKIESGPNIDKWGEHLLLELKDDFKVKINEATQYKE